MKQEAGFGVAVVMALMAVSSAMGEVMCEPAPGTPVNAPIGVCKGMKPGRVAWAHDAQACSWDGHSGFWFEPQYLDHKSVVMMFEKTLLSVTGASSTQQAWNMLFIDGNTRIYNTPQRGGYHAGDRVAIKINLNGAYGTYAPDNGNGVSPSYLRALVGSLVNAGGVPETDIYIYDASRWFSDHLFNAVHDNFPGVHCVDNQGQHGREQVQADGNSHLQFSNTSVPAWNHTWLPTCITKSRFVITVDNFRGHEIAGVTLTGKQWFGSIYRPDCSCGQPGGDPSHWCPQSLHQFVTVRDVLDFPDEPLYGMPMGSYNVLVDLLGHPHLAAKSILFLMDGMYAGPLQSETDGTPSLPVKFHGSAFNNSWACSLFASQDPIALDSVAFDFLRNEPEAVPMASIGCVDNYLHEAALLPHPPSGTVYNPSGLAPLTQPLGCHEHWDGPNTRHYTKIDLVEL